MQTVGSGSRRTVTRVWSSGRKRDEPLELFTKPSRPGRLMEVTACQDLHETPRTQLGLPRRPGERRSITVGRMASYDAIKDLPLEVEECSFEGLEIRLGEFERLTTVIKLRGGGYEGVGEDVVYDPVDHVGQQSHGPPEGLAH